MDLFDFKEVKYLERDTNTPTFSGIINSEVGKGGRNDYAWRQEFLCRHQPAGRQLEVDATRSADRRRIQPPL